MNAAWVRLFWRDRGGRLIGDVAGQRRGDETVPLGTPTTLSAAGPDPCTALYRRRIRVKASFTWIEPHESDSPTEDPYESHIHADHDEGTGP
jgi:hypothetical protein